MTANQTATKPVCPDCGSDDLRHILHGWTAYHFTIAYDNGEPFADDREQVDADGEDSEIHCRDCKADWELEDLVSAES